MLGSHKDIVTFRKTTIAHTVQKAGAIHNKHKTGTIHNKHKTGAIHNKHKTHFNSRTRSLKVHTQNTITK